MLFLYLFFFYGVYVLVTGSRRRICGKAMTWMNFLYFLAHAYVWLFMSYVNEYGQR